MSLHRSCASAHDCHGDLVSHVLTVGMTAVCGYGMDQKSQRACADAVAGWSALRTIKELVGPKYRCENVTLNPEKLKLDDLGLR